jgi:hypothetical protein
MKTDKLINILAKDGETVKPLLHPIMRFAIWFALSTALLIFILPIIEYFFGQGISFTQDITGFFILLISTVILGFLAFVMNSPILLNSTVKIVIGGIFFVWIIRTLIMLFFLDESFLEHIQKLYSGQHHAGCMANTYLFFTIPFFILIIMLRSGYTLEKTWAGFYATTASLSAAELMTAAICSNSDPLHTIAWHIIPIIPIPLGIWLLSEKLLGR